MKQNINPLASQLFLIFNITLILTFPLAGHSPLILRLVSGHPIILTQWMPTLIYLFTFAVSLIGPKNEYTQLVRGFSSLFFLYHLIHLVF